MKDTLEGWLAEDIGKGDFTSESVISNGSCNAHIRGGPGTLSGIDLVHKLLNKMNIEFKTDFSDGDIVLENTFLFTWSLRNEVPLAIAEDDIAPAKALNIPFAILLSKIILSFSLSILSGLSFLIV